MSPLSQCCNAEPLVRSKDKKRGFWCSKCGKEFAEEESAKTPDTIDTLIRDLTRAGSIPKSEARRRIENLISEAIRRDRAELREKLKRKLGAFGLLETDAGISERLLSVFDSSHTK